MTWTLDSVNKLLKWFYPEGSSAQPATISEAELRSEINGQPGCQEIEGIAVDIDADSLPEVFLRSDADGGSYYSKDMLAYLSRSNKFEPANACRQNRSLFLPSYDFDQAGLLPDSAGKITSIAFASADKTFDALHELADQMPDAMLQIHERNNRHKDSDERWVLTAHKRSFFEYACHFNRGFQCEFCQFGELWVQDDYLVGIDAAGVLIAAARGHGNDGLDPDPPTAALTDTGASFINDKAPIDGGDIVSSLSHVFVHIGRNEYEFGTYMQEQFFGKRTVIKIPRIPESATHLDMVLTPTEDVRDGKPVVFLADSTDRNDDAKILDGISQDLSTNFHVVRIPYLIKVEKKKYEYEPDNIYALSYNNVQMENYVENGTRVKRVYMPFYKGYDLYNGIASWYYEQYGYEVIPIRGLDDVSVQGGALRCLTKVTSRRLMATSRTDK